MTMGAQMAELPVASGFKEGVAYMPVPRCDQCGLWGKTYMQEPPGPKWCRAINIHTAADFGCVRWVDRNVVPVPAPAKHDRREGDR